MTPRNSTRARKICFETHSRSLEGRTVLDCHICTLIMDVVIDRWEADHIRRHAEGGTDHPDNLYPICVPCHRIKSARDTTEVAKGKRYGQKHVGIRRTQRPMAGSRASMFKRHMDGTVSKR